MRIILTSDLHGNLPEIPECDLLIIAGDIAPDFMYARQTGHRYDWQDGAHDQIRWFNTTFRDWLDNVPSAYTVAIGGNHDFGLEQKQDALGDLRWVYLQDDECKIDGLRIYGTPWVPNLASWAFHGGYSQIDQAYLDAIPEGIDILVSHGPPNGYGDIIPMGHFGFAEDSHVGDTGMKDMLARVKPRVFVCGHIHEGFGHYRHPDVEEGIFNVAYVDESYRPRGLVESIDLEPR
jgi:Icc-related predicted phosphoesterase